MNRAFLKRTIVEASLILLGCCTALFAYGWVRAWLVSQIDMDRFIKIINSLPKGFLKMSPISLEQLFTYPARVGMTFEEQIVYLIMILWAVSRGSDCVSGKIAGGTMEMLLAQPMARWQMLQTQAIVMVCGTALLAASLWVGMWVGVERNSVKINPPAPTLSIPFTGFSIPLFATGEPEIVPMREVVDMSVFAPAIFNLFALGICVAGLTSWASSWDRYRWRTIGIIAVFCVVQILFEIVGIASETWADLAGLTIFSAYDPLQGVLMAVEDPASAWHIISTNDAGGYVGLEPLGNSLVLIGIGVAGYLAALITFTRRDLPAPL